MLKDGDLPVFRIEETLWMDFRKVCEEVVQGVFCDSAEHGF